MATIQMQRTLIVGLGKAGAKTNEALLAELAHRYGEMMIIQSVAVVTEENAATPLLISPEAGFTAWQDDFDRRVKSALNQISQLNHLPHLLRLGVNLRRPEEIHIIVVVDLTETWTWSVIAQLTARLRDTVERTLACLVGITGVLLYPGPLEPDEMGAGEPGEVATLARYFDRGCFLAGMTNEVGLIIGDANHLIEATAGFLVLLLTEAPPAGLDWEESSLGDWDTILSSFGFAGVRWPDDELIRILSARWSEALLQQMFTPPQDSPQKGDLAQQARESVQQWLIGQKLSPPALLERLAAVMPLLPNYLSDLVADPPWPWLLVNIQTDLEHAAQRWQDEWLVVSIEKLTPALTELRAAWLKQAEIWLAQPLAQNRSGAVLIAQSYLAEMSAMLEAFVEGVEQKKEETETDLADLDQQLGQAAETMAQSVAGFPASPLNMVFSWSSHPLKWPHYWLRCRQAQTSARSLAHLTRGRLITWQMVSYYEELLPFYRQLLADWRELVEKWTRTCQQVVKASTSPSLTHWLDQLEHCLERSTGPWDQLLIAALYQEALEFDSRRAQEQMGTLPEWVTEAIQAETILARLLEQTAQMLTPVVKMAVDQALIRQLPDDRARANWFAGLVELARPFWRYDETTLVERSRAQVRLESWLFLPGGEVSPLAPLAQTLSQPPKLLPSRQPGELGLVTLRRIQWGMEMKEVDTLEG